MGRGTKVDGKNGVFYVKKVFGRCLRKGSRLRRKIQLENLWVSSQARKAPLLFGSSAFLHSPREPCGRCLHHSNAVHPRLHPVFLDGLQTHQAELTTGVLTGTGREELISWVRGYPPM